MPTKTKFRVGDVVVVHHGKGTQLAVIVYRGKTYRARKYSASTDAWTKTAIYVDVIRVATKKDLKRVSGAAISGFIATATDLKMAHQADGYRPHRTERQTTSQEVASRNPKNPKAALALIFDDGAQITVFALDKGKTLTLGERYFWTGPGIIIIREKVGRDFEEHRVDNAGLWAWLGDMIAERDRDFTITSEITGDGAGDLWAKRL